MQHPSRRHPALRAIAVAALLFGTAGLWAGAALSADTADDLREDVDDWLEAARDVYTLDADALRWIWEAYCLKTDTGYEASSDSQRAAVEIGYNWQRQELERTTDLFDDLEDLRDRAEELLDDDPSPGEKTRVEVILSELEKEEAKLRKLENGAVLRGSAHPFVQYSLEYGKRMHDDMCDDYTDDEGVCDEEYPGAGERPDLVTVGDDGLVIYEFKPNNSEQIGKGQDQLKRYLPAVKDYYKKFFPNGRGGGFPNGYPDSDLGGRDFAEAIEESDDAWTGDEKDREVQVEVKTYEPCEKKFE